MGIFYGVAPERLGLMADVSDRNRSPESKSNSRDWRRQLGPETISGKVAPSAPRVEYSLSDKRISRGEPGQVTKPGADGRRIGHGEPPVELQDDDEQMTQKIRRNIGLQPVQPEDDEGAEGAVARVKVGKTVTQREGNPMTFSEAKRSVDLAIRRGQLPEFQREGALHVAQTSPRAWKQLLACSPIDVDERKFIGTVRPEFRSVGPRQPGRTATHREIFSNLGLIDGGWNPTW